VIPRYSLPEIAELFSDAARFGAWLEVEILAVEAWAELGVVPAADARTVRERAGFDVDAIHERERVTEHDVAAFVDVVQAQIGPPAGAWVHYGLTSSDVVDTALALQMTRALGRLRDAAATLEAAIAKRAREYRDTPMVGRTHGIHAEPTTFGAKLALWAMQVRRDRERLQRARAAIAVGKLSGAVGTYSNVDPRVEQYVCGRLGLTPVPATQVLPRDRHAEVLYACASVGASVESFALEIRHLQRTEVREVEEGFREGRQKGSSAMPHKRNPVKSEQLCGLARVLRGNLQAALENVALWHERDISHSSVERVIVPDSLMLAYYELVKFTEIIDRIRVYPERVLRNLDASYGLVFSQPVLLALVEAGMTRDDAYRVVQRNAMHAWQEEQAFRELLRNDTEVTSVLDEARIDACFDLKRALANTSRVFDALDALDEWDEQPEASDCELGIPAHSEPGPERPDAKRRERKR
jgi:adenylosuccinate lyase